MCFTLLNMHLLCEYEMNKDILNSGNSGDHSLAISLIILISINIGVEILRFWGMFILANKEKKQKRQLLIEEKRINVIELLYKNLDSLRLFDRSEESELLSNIKNINLFITQNKIYIPKNLLDKIYEILDYFKSVLTDYRLKDITMEVKLFDDFCDEYNNI